MSSFAGNCYWCGKPVMHKTFFGTLHVCLSQEELSQRRINEEQNRVYQKALFEQQRAYCKGLKKGKE